MLQIIILWIITENMLEVNWHQLKRQALVLKNMNHMLVHAKKIFMSEPLSYLKSCINTFMYVEDKGYTEGSGDGYVPKVIIKIYYSLILAAIINTVILVLAIVKKSWFSLIMAISLYLQAGMVFTLSPGAYYKYYMPTCICVYLNVIIILVDLLEKRKTINE